MTFLVTHCTNNTYPIRSYLSGIPQNGRRMVNLIAFRMGWPLAGQRMITFCLDAFVGGKFRHCHLHWRSTIVGGIGAGRAGNSDSETGGKVQGYDTHTYTMHRHNPSTRVQHAESTIRRTPGMSSRLSKRQIVSRSQEILVDEVRNQAQRNHSTDNMTAKTWLVIAMR